MRIYITNPALVRAASLFTSSEESRYYLRGVHFSHAEQGGIYIVSTDGHRASIGYDPDGFFEDGDDSAIVRFPPDFLKHLKPTGSGDTLYLVIDGDMAHTTESLANGCPINSGVVKWIDATYPAWQGMIPDSAFQTCHGAFNPRYLADFRTVRAALGLKIGAIYISGENAISPHIVRIDGAENWFGVIMPMQCNMPSTLPSWYGKRQSKAA